MPGVTEVDFLCLICGRVVRDVSEKRGNLGRQSVERHLEKPRNVVNGQRYTDTWFCSAHGPANDATVSIHGRSDGLGGVN